MGNFNKFNKGGGNRKFGGGGRSFGGRGNAPKQMYPAICSDCGDSCEVPFRPSGDHPVFCRDCFKSQGGGSETGRKFSPRGLDVGNNNRGGGREFRGNAAPDFKKERTVSYAQFEALQAKVDKILSIVSNATKESASLNVGDNVLVEEKVKKTSKKAVKKVDAPAKKSTKAKTKKK